MVIHVCFLVLLTKGLAASSSGQCDVTCRDIDALKEEIGGLRDRVTTLEGGRSDAVCKVRDIRRPDGTLPRDCSEIYGLGGRADGVYFIKPRDAPSPFRVLCELNLDGGWTVIMRRFNGSVDFYRKWTDYKRGFGSLAGEHWLGNDKIHWLTSQKNYRLQLDMRYWASKISYYALYHRFSVDSEAAKYKLHIHGYHGNVGHDGMSPHSGKLFSTWDRDNDEYSGHCAQTYKGAFWYHGCHSHTNPNGLYKASCGGYDCIEWNKAQSLDQILMKVKHD